MVLHLNKYFLNEKSEKHKSLYLLVQTQQKPVKSKPYWKETRHNKSAPKDEHIANICHGQQQIMYNFW